VLVVGECVLTRSLWTTTTAGAPNAALSLRASTGSARHVTPERGMASTH
jgi:hypothetical protein